MARPKPALLTAPTTAPVRAAASSAAWEALGGCLCVRPQSPHAQAPELSPGVWAVIMLPSPEITGDLRWALPNHPHSCTHPSSPCSGLCIN